MHCVVVVGSVRREVADSAKGREIKPGLPGLGPGRDSGRWESELASGQRRRVAKKEERRADLQRRTMG